MSAILILFTLRYSESVCEMKLEKNDKNYGGGVGVRGAKRGSGRMPTLPRACFFPRRKSRLHIACLFVLSLMDWDIDMPMGIRDLHCFKRGHRDLFYPDKI